MESNEKDITTLWHRSRLSVTDTFENPPVILKVEDSIVGTLGNFSASTGKAKSKKTFNVSAIVAAAMLNGKVLNYNATLPKDKNKVLYIDTEQSPYHCIEVMRRILRLADLPTTMQPENFEFLSLRRYAPPTRIAIIRKAIYATEGLGLVIIDGVRDLAYDINSPSEATEIINRLMTWTDERNIHIHTVLHQNKGDDNARGHLGSELNNKAETVLQVVKSKVDPEQSIVSPVHIRSIEFNTFAFYIDSEGLPQLAKDFSTTNATRGFKYEDLTDEEHYDVLKEVFQNNNEFRYAELIQALTQGYAAIGYEYGRNKIVELNKFLINKGFIFKEGKKYRLKPQS